MNINFIENVYSRNDIEYNRLSSTNEQLNSFVNVAPGAYPPRITFEVCTHNLEKDSTYILKFDDGGRAILAINNKEIKIIDIFLKDNFQGQSILKNMINTIRYLTKDIPTIEFITLNSLVSGIIAWHKIGFEFYNLTDKFTVKSLLSTHLGYVVDLKELNKQIIESNNCYTVLASDSKLSSVPMFLRIKK